jgi:hypothetical protein
MRAFIIRPFTAINGIDFPEVQKQLLAPALARLGIQGGTTELFSDAGNIREDMFQQLLVADVVIADISVQNSNVYYELGIRHALRSKHTYLVRAKVDKSSVETARERDVPFDILTDRYLEYDPSDPAAKLQNLVDGLKETLASQRITDSPVFALLPGLEQPDRSRFIGVPSSFREELELAIRELGRLGLFANEVRGLPWESEGLRLVARAQSELNWDAEAKKNWEYVRKLDPDDIEANLNLGIINRRMALITTLNQQSFEDVVDRTRPERSGNLTDIKERTATLPEGFRLLQASNQALQRVVESVKTEGSARAEALFLLGRNIEDRWTSSWKSIKDPLVASKALESPGLSQAYDKYRLAFYQNLNSFTPGLNALRLLTLRLELARKLPNVWEGLVPSEDEPDKQLESLERERTELVGAVKTSLEAARKKDEITGQDTWKIEIGRAEFQFLTNPKSRNLVFTFRSALSGAPESALDDARRRLEMFRMLELEVFKDTAEKVLGVFLVPASTRPVPDRVLLFTGLPIDDPRTQSKCFPNSIIGEVRDAIRTAVKKEKDRTEEGTLVTIASGANGGDLLFHEVCEELGIVHRLFLSLPPNSFRSVSVSPAGPEWTDRFDELIKKIKKGGDVLFLSPSDDLPMWLSVRKDYTFNQRARLWLMYEALALGAKNLTFLSLLDKTESDKTENEDFGGASPLRIIAAENDVALVTIDVGQFLSDSSGSSSPL